MHKRGFTLIELLVVIAIIGLLASIISVSLVSARAKGRDARRISDIKTISLAIEEYYNDNGAYPAAIYGNAAFTPYMSGGVVPCDPLAPNGGCASTNYQYLYRSWRADHASGICNATNPPVAYHLGAVFEDSTNPALNQDADEGTAGSLYTACGSGLTDFVGNSKDCGTSATSPDLCYDVTN